MSSRQEMDAPMAGYCSLVDEVERLRQANAALKALLEAQSRGMAKKMVQMRRERQRIRLYTREARAADRAAAAEVRRLRGKVSQFAVRARAAEERAEEDEIRADAGESLYLEAVERAKKVEEEAEDAAAASDEALRALRDAAADRESAERLNAYYDASAAAVARSRAQWAEIAVDKTNQLAAQLRCRAEQAEAELARTQRAEAEARAFGMDMFESSLGWRAECEAERARADDLAVRARMALAGLERERARADGLECYAAVLLEERDLADRAVGSAAAAAAGSPGPAGGFNAGLAAPRRQPQGSEGSDDSTSSTGTVVRYEMDDDWVHDFKLVRE